MNVTGVSALGEVAPGRDLVGARWLGLGQKTPLGSVARPWCATVLVPPNRVVRVTGSDGPMCPRCLGEREALADQGSIATGHAGADRRVDEEDVQGRAAH
ncbi:MAG: hypothetical protein ACRDVP_06275 [Acidimicrobiales bacterium]